MKSLKSLLEKEILQVDWKNIISVNTDREKKDARKHDGEEMNFLFI